MKPVVFILDIDGTLIGDISQQVMMFDMLDEIKASKKLLDMDEFKYKLLNGLIRPYLINFINDIRAHYTYAEFFIYTASKKDWAEYLVKIIESTLNIKFNRPLFTRNDCLYINNEYKKSISKIKNRIFNTLKKRYPELQLSDLKDRMMMIDNSRVFLEHDYNIVYCPTYSFKYPENILLTIKRNIFEKYTVDIFNVISKYVSGIPITNSYLKFQKYYYSNYINDLSNMKKPEDKFWIYLRNLLITKNICAFDKKNIDYINRKVSHAHTKIQN
jgi:hypothetical protein